MKRTQELYEIRVIKFCKENSFRKTENIEKERRNKQIYYGNKNGWCIDVLNVLKLEQKENQMKWLREFIKIVNID